MIARQTGAHNVEWHWLVNTARLCATPSYSEVYNGSPSQATKTSVTPRVRAQPNLGCADMAAIEAWYFRCGILTPLLAVLGLVVHVIQTSLLKDTGALMHGKRQEWRSAASDYQPRLRMLQVLSNAFRQSL